MINDKLTIHDYPSFRIRLQELERQRLIKDLVRCKDVLTRQKMPAELHSSGSVTAVVSGEVS